MRQTKPHIEEHIMLVLSQFSPISYVEYAEIAGINKPAAHMRLTKLWDSGQLHIAGWDRDGKSHPAPLYAIGRVVDEPKPAKLTVAERVAKYQQTPKGKASVKKHTKRRVKREKLKRLTDPAWAERQRMHSRNSARRKHGYSPKRELVRVSTFDPILAALMGAK